MSLRTLLVGLGLVGLLGAAASADTIIGRYTDNVWFVNVDANAGFTGAGSDPILDYADSQNSVSGSGFFGTAAIASATTTATPTTGALKDKAQGTSTLELDLGSPIGAIPNDELHFSFSGTVSAQSATNSAGNPADAVFTGQAMAFMALRSTGTIPHGTVLGHVDLPALRSLGANETLLGLQVQENSTQILALTAGDPATSIDLKAFNTYRIILNYEARAPYGTDPSFGFSYDAGLAPIPEPATLALVALGGLAMLARRRKKN